MAVDHSTLESDRPGSARADDDATGFLRLERLSKFYGDTTAVDDLSVSVNKGELVAFLGPSGCGKTTTLRMIAGFIETDRGEIHIDGRRVDTLPSRQRGTAMVFQDYALFPHMTVHDNIAFGLKMRKVPKADIRRRVEEVLELVQLRDVGKKYPKQLSGGMKQRVALARAIVVEPQILLLDEPLSNLDAKLRKQLRISLRELHDRIGITTVFVTHDIEEAFYLADRVVVMNGGRLEQLDTPENIYSHPASLFVADFVGHTNILEGHLSASPDGGSVFRGGGLELRTADTTEETAHGRYTIPPHLIDLSVSRPERDNVLQGTVAMSAFVGASYIVLVDVGETRLQCDLVQGSIDSASLQAGQPVWLSWDSTEGHYVPA
jgi:putative spermidine/putrescine transport system ATP-binding protein